MRVAGVREDEAAELQSPAPVTKNFCRVAKDVAEDVNVNVAKNVVENVCNYRK